MLEKVKVLNRSSPVNRDFVRFRNDINIPADRIVEVLVTEAVSEKDFPLISVIIPTADAFRHGHFPALLAQLSDQNFRKFEVIVVKGDSRQGRAINTGASIARGRFILTLDDDTLLHRKDTLSTLMKAFVEDENIGMAGGMNVIPEEASLLVKLAMAQIPRRSTPPVKGITESDLAEHPLLMMRKGIFCRIGGENELIPRGLDPYLRQEFRRAGHKVVVVPGALYSHLPPSNFIRLVAQFFRNGRLAAFSNKFYGQWMVETPAEHVSIFIERRPFLFRLLRHMLSFARKILMGHWVYLSVYTAYSLGFIWGWIVYRNPRQA